MSEREPPYFVRPTSRSRRDILQLPEAVAAACFEFIRGPLAENPYRVSKELVGPFAGQRSARRGEYRIVFRIDEDSRTVVVSRIDHRRNAYRP